MADILLLSPDQRERMVVDLLAWCDYVDEFTTMLSSVPGLTVEHKFVWVDDDRIGECSGININIESKE